MSRPYSWYPLAGSDPVPGDPVAVRIAGTRYQEVAEAIEAAARSLAEVTELARVCSQAVDAVEERAAEVGSEISHARSRYAGVGEALVAYARELERAQDLSLRALESAQAAQRASDTATTEVTRAVHALSDAIDVADPDGEALARRRLTRARIERDDADVAVTRARAELEEAVRLRDEAARRATEAVRAATDADGLDDGWWENWGRRAALWISEHVSKAAMIAGVAALLLGWVPIVGQALALVAGIAGALVLVADIALMVWDDGSWTDVAIGVLGVVSLGTGRVAGTLTKNGRRHIHDTAAKRAQSVAKKSGDPALRASPEQLIPTRLAEPPTRIKNLAEWRTETAAGWGQLRHGSAADRIHALVGNGPLARDLEALRDAPRLTHRSTLAAQSEEMAARADHWTYVSFGTGVAGVAGSVSSSLTEAARGDSASQDRPVGR